MVPRFGMMGAVGVIVGINLFGTALGCDSHGSRYRCGATGLDPFCPAWLKVANRRSRGGHRHRCDPTGAAAPMETPARRDCRRVMLYSDRLRCWRLS